jgi:hypothetical protein
MAEIDFVEEWKEIRVNIAADDPRLKNVVSWMMGQQGDDKESEARYEYMAKAACRHYGLDPEQDLDIVIEACEDKIFEDITRG